MRVQFGKGGKHRIVTLAEELVPGLKHQIKQVALLLEQDLRIPEFSGVWMPEALARKYPNACKSVGWQYLFPSSRLSVDPASGLIRRHHYDENNVNKIVKQAARNAGIRKEVTCHTSVIPLPRTYCNLVDIRTVQQQLGHFDVKTTEIYTHVLKQGAHGVRSPLSSL